MDTSFLTLLDNLHSGFYWMSGVVVLGVLFGAYLYFHFQEESRLGFETSGGRRQKVVYDKRRARRLPSNLLFKPMGFHGEVAPISKLIDMSPTGARMISSLRLSRGARIQGKLHTPEQDELQITGHIVWSKRKPEGTQYGIVFESVQSIT